MEPPEGRAGEELLLREAGELLGISRKGVQHLVNQELLRRELRITPAGTKYGVVFRSDVLRLAEARRNQVAQGNDHRGPGRPVKLPEQSRERAGEDTSAGAIATSAAGLAGRRITG